MNSLLDAHLNTSNNSMALGGYLALIYTKEDDITDIVLATTQTIPALGFIAKTTVNNHY